MMIEFYEFVILQYLTVGTKMYKLIVFVPSSHKESLKSALFSEGAGKQGDYSHCCFETEGVGQFMPNNQANPHIGTADKLELVREFRVEFLVGEDSLERVIRSLKENHPYEEPAYDIIKLYQIEV